MTDLSPSLTVRPATEADLPALPPLFEAARAIMRSDGNLHQWVNGYPGLDAVREDIARGGGFVLELAHGGLVLKEDAPGPGQTAPCASRIVGYFALLPSPEPTYGRIDGAWLTDGPYGVIHRIASYPDVHGVFGAIIGFAAARYPHLRIDTHRDNRIMQHLVLKHGFTYCGIIWLLSGDERLAFER